MRATKTSRVSPLLSAALEGEAEEVRMTRGMISAAFHSKPVARSLTILGDAVEFVHGRTDKSTWQSFRVTLTWEAMEMLGLDSRHITSRKELHRVARLYKATKKEGARR